MHIILDANSLIDEGYGASPRAGELLSIAGLLGYQVHVPQVVLEELVGHYSRNLGDKIRTLRRQIANLSWLVDRELNIPIDASDQANESILFRDRLLARLDAANVNTPDYPTNSHEEIVKRATSRRRPFDDSGSGYRDTLIWFNLLDLAGDLDGRILLVAKDKDFRGDHGSLHDDLINDLDRNEQPSDRVVLVGSISELLEQHIHPSVQETFVQDPLGALQILGFDFVKAIALRIQPAFLNADLDPRQIGLSWECEFTNLRSVDEISNLNVVDVREIHSNEFSLHITIDFIGTFEVFIPKNDWTAGSGQQFQLVDPDWNDNGVLAAIRSGAQCELDLSIDVLEPQEYGADVSTLVLSRQVEMTVAP